MFFKNTLCDKCLGCNKLELETKYFQGVFKCKNFMLVEPDPKEHNQITIIKTKKIQESINKIHEILGMTNKNYTMEGEQMKIL